MSLVIPVELEQNGFYFLRGKPYLQIPFKKRVKWREGGIVMKLCKKKIDQESFSRGTHVYLQARIHTKVKHKAEYNLINMTD